VSILAPLPSIDTSVTPEEAFRLRDLAKDRVVLEVGSWRGFSTVTMAQVAVKVHAVDWHRGDGHAGHDESLSYLMAALDDYEVRERVVVHVGSSAEMVPLFPMGYFDFAFIDAYHTAEAVRLDAELVIPRVRSFGLIGFHDYGDERFSVTEVVDSLEGVRLEHVTGSLAVVRKL
jgi:predicted O-methyltransferase YrrM